MNDSIIESAEKKHKYWYDFCDQFGYSYEGGILSKIMIGYETIKKVEEYAKTHPEIKVVNVDDASFCDSIVVLIPHPNMGITAIFIPQCTSQQNEFFLYPLDSKNLLETIAEMKKEHGI